MDALSWITKRYITQSPLGPGVRLARDVLSPTEGAVIVKEAHGLEERAALTIELQEHLRLDHPSFRGIVAHGDDETSTTVVFSYIDGIDLADFLAASPDQVLACAEEILRALVYLHHHGRGHGDLKPANIIVSEGKHGSRVHLIDLGLLAPLGSIVRGGTQEFIPPEYLEGSVLSVAGDLYSFGATLRATEVDLPKSLEHLVQACLAENPAHRPASAESALAMVGAVATAFDRQENPSRVGGLELLTKARAMIAAHDGQTLVVEGLPKSGSTRFLNDALKDAQIRGLPLAHLSPGADGLEALGSLLLHRSPSDPLQTATMVAASAAREGIFLVMDLTTAVQEPTKTALPIVAATLKELGQSGLLIVGADEELSRSLEQAGAERCALAPLTRQDIATLMRWFGAVTPPAMIDAVFEVSEGRAGVCVLLARELAAQPNLEERSVIRLGEELMKGGRQPLPEGDIEDARQAIADSDLATAERILHRIVTNVEVDIEGPLHASVLLAHALARKGELDEATQVLEQKEEQLDPTTRLHMARWFERLGRYERARQWAENVRDDTSEQTQVEAIVVASNAALAMGEPDVAGTMAAEGLDLSMCSGTEAEVRLLCARSDVALTKGDTGEAKIFAVKAQEAAQEQRDHSLLAEAIAREASALVMGDEPERARDRYKAALESKTKSGDYVGLPVYIMNLATSEHALGELGEALNHYQQAAHLAKKFGRKAVHVASLVNWASLLVSVGVTEEAQSILEEARCIGAGAIYMAQRTLVEAEILGRTSVEKGRDMARAAKEEFQSCGASRQALEATLLEAELALESQDARPALALEPLWDDLRRGGLEARATHLLARAHLQEGNSSRALDLALEAATLAGTDHDREGQALWIGAMAHAQAGTGAEEPLMLRAREALGKAALTLPEGLRERFIQHPLRLAIMRPKSSQRQSNSLGSGARRILHLLRRVLAKGDEADLLEAAVDEAVALSGAERAFLLWKRKGRQAAVAVARNMVPRGRSRKRVISRTVAERVLATSEMVVTASALDAPEMKGAQSILDLGLRSILCVPVRGPSDVKGALYLDHRFETGRFGPDECDAVQSLADVIGIIVELTRLQRDAESKAIALEQANQALAEKMENQEEELRKLTHLLGDGGETLKDYGGMVGKSKGFLQAVEVGQRSAKTDIPILIQGESGTGKELMARYVHAQSSRRTGPFQALNCAALPDGLLESELFGHVKGAFTGAHSDQIGLFRAAQTGTVFLDEIGEMSPKMQQRLLRTLQEHEVRPLGSQRAIRLDVRVLSATNRVLFEEVEKGRFRQDLYYRLAGVVLELPPLRDRMEDLLAISQALLKRIADEKGMRLVTLSRDARRALMSSPWKGNIRELQQALRRAVINATGDVVTAADLDLHHRGQSRKMALQKVDQKFVESALREARGNRSEAARILGVSRPTLYRWMGKYGLVPD